MGEALQFRRATHFQGEMIGPENEPEKARERERDDDGPELEISSFSPSGKVGRAGERADIYRQMTFQKFFWTDDTPTFPSFYPSFLQSDFEVCVDRRFRSAPPAAAAAGPLSRSFAVM